MAGSRRDRRSNVSPAKNSVSFWESLPSRKRIPDSIRASNRETRRPSGSVTVSFRKESSAFRICGSFSAANRSAQESLDGSTREGSLSSSIEKRNSVHIFAALAVSKFWESEESSALRERRKSRRRSRGTASRILEIEVSTLSHSIRALRKPRISGNVFFASERSFESVERSEA